MPEFYVLRDRCLSESGFVSHISMNAFSAIVSHTSISYCALLFTYEEACVIRSLLEKLVNECCGYDIVRFSDLK